MANKTVYPYGTGGQLPASVGIVNDLVTGGADKALSAQQGVVLNGRLGPIEDLFSGSDIVTEIDLTQYSSIKFNLENPSAWAASSTYKCELVPVADLGEGSLRFKAESFKFSYAFLKSNNAEAGVAPDLCTGTSVVTIPAGSDPINEDIPADCNYLYVYLSSGDTALGKIHLYSVVHTDIPAVLMADDVIDSLNNSATKKPLSANQGKVLYEYLNHATGTETIEKKNSNTVADDIGQYSASGNSRGYILLARGNASHYGIELSIASGTTVKYGMVLSANAPGQTAVYDSGWKSSGTYSISEANGNNTVQNIILSFTYISGGYGVPSLSEVLQYATFRLYTIIDVYDGLIPQVEDLDNRVSSLEATLIDPFYALKRSQDAYAIGTSASRKLACFTVYDLFTERSMQDLQSVVVDQAKKRLILNRANTVSRKLDFSSGEFSFGDVMVGSIGHGNDACIIGDYMWVAGGDALGPTDIKRIYKSDLGGSSTYVDLTIPDNASGGTSRVIGGVCRYTDDDTLLITSYDYRGSTNSTGDLLVVYTYKISDGTLTEVFSTQWNGWFVQGATYIGGYLYIATNMVPSGSAYTGIRVWKIDAISWQLESPMEFSGRYEPEGIDSMWDNVTPVLYMGMFSGQTSPKQCKILKLEAF